MGIFERNKYIHNSLIDFAEKLVSNKKYDKALEFISSIAFNETKYYYGYLSSIRLEKLLLKVGEAIFPFSNFKKKDVTQKKVLHIASELYNIGGHTRVVIDWIKYDTESISEILITDQKQIFDLPTSSTITFLEDGDAIEKAQLLRNFLAQNYFDVIVIHQNMDDVIPTIALWDFKEKMDSLVLFYNHSNFRFSLGNIIAHKRINFCEGDKIISEKYRIPSEDCVLPFVLGDEFETELPINEKKQLQQSLHIEHKTTFLTIGTPYKYEPYQKLNFFKEWNAFLSRNPNCALIVIGCDQTIFKKYCPDDVCSKNLLLIGAIDHPSDYYKIADYIVDIYPLQTGLGTVQGLNYHLPPILPYCENPYVMAEGVNTLYPKELFKFLTYTDQHSYFQFIKKEAETHEYKNNSKKIIEDFVTKNLLAKSWRKQLYQIYESTPIKNKKDLGKDDVLNISKTSENWLKYNDSLMTDFALIILYFKFKASYNITIMYYYFILSLKHRKMVARKLFFHYLINN